MTNSSSSLSDEQRQLVQKWFDDKVAGGVIGKCSVCGARNWQLVPEMVQALPWSPEMGLMIGGVAYPFVMITCTNCGNTHFHSAVMMGLASSSSSSYGNSEVAEEGP